MRIETTTSIGTWLHCRRLHEYKYEKLYDVPGYSQALVLGSLVHKMIEAHWGDNTFDEAVKRFEGEFPDNRAEIQREALLATRIGNAWVRYWEASHTRFANRTLKAIDVEQKWSYSVDDRFELHGVRDAYVEHPTGRYLYELKTSGARDKDAYKRSLETNNQIDNNLIALTRDGEAPKGVIYDIIWKPQIRQKKSETEDDFWSRYADEYVMEPAKYFDRLVIIRTEEKLNDQMAELERVAREMHRGVVYRTNMEKCDRFGKACPFREACSDNNDEMLVGFNKRATKHREIK